RWHRLGAAPRRAAGTGAGGRGALAGRRPGRHPRGGHLATVVLHLGPCQPRTARSALPRLGPDRAADRGERSPGAGRLLRVPRDLRGDQLTTHAPARPLPTCAPPSTASASPRFAAKTRGSGDNGTL